MKVDLPLAQKRIVVTRAEEQSDFFASELEQLGARAIILPTIRIEPAQLSPADAARISGFGNYDVVIFTSINAVRNVLSHVVLKKSADGRPFVVAIGKKTAESITEMGLTPDFVPAKFNSDELMKSLRAFDWKNKHVLIPKGNLAGSDVAESIRSQGGTAEEVVVYNTVPNDSIDEKLKTLVISGEFDAVVFYSPSQIRNFLGIFGGSTLEGKEIAVIGPTTKKAAEKLGIKVDVMPENSTTESLIASMVEHEKADNDLLLRVLEGKQVERTPIWIMRQAGRYLPEYMAVRAKYDFLTMCRTPELSAEITIQPVDIIGVDAAIIFSDILVLPEAMGLNLVVEEGKGGPRFTNPVRNRSALSSVHDADCEVSLKYVADAIRLTVQRLSGKVPLIGFCGSPWTLFAYMVEGKGGEFVHARSMLYNDPPAAHLLLERLAKNAVSYLKMQHEAGASVVQIFDTWAGVLPTELYEEFSLRYIRHIVQSLLHEVPVIVFSKGANHELEQIAATGASAVGVNWTIPIDQAAERVGGVVQGNMDPAVLFAGADAIKTAAKKVLERAPRGKHIFNLGHGILPGTPVDGVKSLVDFVKGNNPV